MGALTRAPQVVALGDPVIGRPQSFQVSVDPTATAGPLRPLRSAHDALDEVLPTLPLRTVHRPLERRLVRLLSALAYDGALDALPTAGEATGRDRAVTAEYLPEGTGIPMTGGDVVESTNAEVARTVERVFEHIRDRPEQSLAVVTVSEQHARRVAAVLEGWDDAKARAVLDGLIELDTALARTVADMRTGLPTLSPLTTAFADSVADDTATNQEQKAYA